MIGVFLRLGLGILHTSERIAILLPEFGGLGLPCLGHPAFIDSAFPVSVFRYLGQGFTHPLFHMTCAPQRGATHENILGLKPPIFLLTNPPAAETWARTVVLSML